MCIAILCPKGKQITEQQFMNSWENNYNGAGFMYNDKNNKLRVVKEMEDKDKLYKKYVQAVNKFPDATFVIHFRISNRGVISLENCHPFKVNNQLGFVHNGTITSVDKDDVKSDTNVFNRTILRNLPNIGVDFLENKGIKLVLEEFIGRSKLIFLDNNGNYSIFNENLGDWEDGIWYSNDSHKQVNNYVDSGGTRVYKSGSTAAAAFNSKNTYGRYGSTIYDDDYMTDYGWSSKAGIWHSKSGLNSKISDNEAKTIRDFIGDEDEDSDYILSNGKGKCTCCDADLGENELVNKYGECLSCLSEEEGAEVVAAAVRDGYILTDLSDGSIIASKDEEEETCQCDACLESNKVGSMTFINGWNTNLCKECLEDMYREGYISEDDMIGSCLTVKN